MHIEPGVVDGAKVALGYTTALGAFGLAGKMVRETLDRDGAVSAFAARTLAATALVFGFFQVLPHAPVGVSEVHLILASTLFLMFGAGATALGLAFGLLAQGLLFAPWDLPQYGMNVTTLLAPLFAMQMLAKRIIPEGTAYQDVTYGQALKLSLSYQAGIVAWVAFWAFYGYGFTAETLAQVTTFGASYALVVAVEPLVDLSVLAWIKASRLGKDASLLQARLFTPAA